MARRKPLNPMQRIPSGEVMQTVYQLPDSEWRTSNGNLKSRQLGSNGSKIPPRAGAARPKAGFVELAVCVFGIYASLYASKNYFTSCYTDEY